MAYDEDLAARIREMLTGTPGLTERAMFGGLAFMMNGHMAVVASGKGGLMVRVDPETYDELLTTTEASVTVMRGREMRGWLRVSKEQVRTQGPLTYWVGLGVEYARGLKPKD